MPISIADLERQSKSPLQKYVLKGMLRDNDLAALMPWYNVEELSPEVLRYDTLPSVGYRAVGGAYSESTGKTARVSEGVYSRGGDILFDRVFDKTKNVIEDPKKTQINMKTKAMALEFNRNFILGDHVTNVNEPEGLNKRIASYLPTRQSISIGASYDPGTSSATINNLIYYMHQLIDLAGLRNAPMLTQKTAGGEKGTNMRAGCILANRDFILAFEKLLRAGSNLVDTTQDNYGRFFRTFAGVPLIDVGLQADQSTEIIANNYGAGADETRVFAVRFSTSEGDDGLAGIQLSPLEVYDPVAAGEVGASATAGTPAKSLRFEWWNGYAGWGKYYAARLTGLQDPSTWA